MLEAATADGVEATPRQASGEAELGSPDPGDHRRATALHGTCTFDRREAVEQLLQDDPAFEPCEGRAEAEVVAEPERHVWVRIATHVEVAGVGTEDVLVTIRGSEEQQQWLTLVRSAGPPSSVSHVAVLMKEITGVVYRRSSSTALFRRPWSSLGDAADRVRQREQRGRQTTCCGWSRCPRRVAGRGTSKARRRSTGRRRR